MHSRLVVVLAVAAAAMAPGYAQATGMFCHPGENWHTIDQGTVDGEGWSLANLTKPEGGQMRIVWRFVDFDDGPATAGFVYGQEPEHIDAEATVYTDDHERHVSTRGEAAGFQVDEEVSAGRGPALGGGTVVASLTLGPTFVDQDLHILQYVAGEDHDGHRIEWTVEGDSCLVDTDPPVSVAAGDNAVLLTPDDLDGTLNAEVRAYVPLLPANGAVALHEARAEAAVDGIPYLNTWWANRAGSIDMDGPGGLTMADVTCFDYGDSHHCRDWGAHGTDTLLPGTYEFTASGFTDPQDPTRSTHGPYITLLGTQLPGGD